jgi:hypothetical protein
MQKDVSIASHNSWSGQSRRSSFDEKLSLDPTISQKYIAITSCSLLVEYHGLEKSLCHMHIAG